MPPSDSADAVKRPSPVGEPPATGGDAPAAADLRFLDAATVRFRHEGSAFQMRRDGEADWREVGLVRLFPLTEAETWVAVVDEKGKELGVLQQVADLTAEDAAAVRQELRRRYLVPQIRRILACRERFHLVEWTVETDRGRRTFLTKDERDQIKEPLPGRLSLTDVDGNRYDIPDVEVLDLASRRLLEPRV
jgi:hypothetical protein